MFVAKVVGNVVSTNKDERLTGFKLMVICKKLTQYNYSKDVEVSIDAVGAGIGEEVLVVNGAAARAAVNNVEVPIDSAIIGIVDTMDIDV